MKKQCNHDAKLLDSFDQILKLIWTLFCFLFLFCVTIGFTETTRACCGIGEGPTNVDPLIPCGASGLVNGKLIIANNVCANPNEYVSWDGVHITEAVNRIVVEKFLAGRYLQPFYNLSSVCNLSFAQF